MFYEHHVTELFTDPAKLEIPGLHDRGYVFIDQSPVGILSRGQDIFSMPISIRPGEKLQVQSTKCILK